MITHTNDIWDNQFLTKSPIFWPLLPFAQSFVESHAIWPGLADYQRFFEAGAGKRYSGHNALLQFVEQGHKPEQFEEGYEPRIFLNGEIQTRQHNWHDFFQVLVWRMMPGTKTIINQLHYEALKLRYNADPAQRQRNPLENALTQFDECGAIILSTNPELLTLIENFQWKALFWQHRSDVIHNMKCIVFGHALYEKALNPYIGMTAHSILLSVEREFLEQPIVNIISQTDDRLTNFFQTKDAVKSPQDFSPFPLLGMPGWDKKNEEESYYNNSNYFRLGRRHKT